MKYNTTTIITFLNIRKRVFRQSDDPFYHLPMYGTVEDPLFKAKDIALILDYSNGHTDDMMRFVSYRDKLSLVPGNIGHQRGGNRKSV